jgi:hypothetical protein
VHDDDSFVQKFVVVVRGTLFCFRRTKIKHVKRETKREEEEEEEEKF